MTTDNLNQINCHPDESFVASFACIPGIRLLDWLFTCWDGTGRIAYYTINDWLRQTHQHSGVGVCLLHCSWCRCFVPDWWDPFLYRKMPVVLKKSIFWKTLTLEESDLADPARLPISFQLLFIFEHENQAKKLCQKMTQRWQNLWVSIRWSSLQRQRLLHVKQVNQHV